MTYRADTLPLGKAIRSTLERASAAALRSIQPFVEIP